MAASDSCRVHVPRSECPEGRALLEHETESVAATDASFASIRRVRGSNGRMRDETPVEAAMRHRAQYARIATTVFGVEHAAPG